MKKLLIIFAASILGMVACNDKVELKNEKVSMDEIKNISDSIIPIATFTPNSVELLVPQTVFQDFFNQYCVAEGYTVYNFELAEIYWPNRAQGYYCGVEITGNAVSSQMDNHTFHFSIELDVDFEEEIIYIINGGGGNGGGGPIFPPTVTCTGKGCSKCDMVRDMWNRPVGCNCRPSEQDDPQSARCDHSVSTAGGASWASFFLTLITAWFSL